jgi:conjugative transfer region protein (TIGR03748 family)
MRIKLVCVLMGWCFVQSGFAHTDNAVSAGTDRRYIGYREAPPREGQIHPLKAPMGLIRNDSLTIGRAMKDVLAGSGYLLAHPLASDPQVMALLDARLPLQQRDLRQLTVLEALRILAGEPWQVTLDPVHRLVSFELPIGYEPEPVHLERKLNNGLALLGFTDDIETTRPAVPEHLHADCPVITRDLTLDWSVRRYWCYPDPYANTGACHD